MRSQYLSLKLCLLAAIQIALALPDHGAAAAEDFLEIASSSPKRFLHFSRHHPSSGTLPEALTAIWLNSSGTDGWAMSSGSNILHYDGKMWEQQQHRDGLASSSISTMCLSESGKAGWAFLHNGEVLRFDGKAWRFIPPISYERIPNDVWLNADGTEGWAVGSNGLVLHLTGQTWREYQPISGRMGFNLNAIWLNEKGTQGWAVGDSGTLLQFNGEDWTANLSISSDTDVNLKDIAMDPSGSKGWIVTEEGLIIAFNEGSIDWTASPMYMTYSFTSVWVDETGERAWASANHTTNPKSADYHPFPSAPNGVILYFNGEKWSTYFETPYAIFDLAFSSSFNEGWAVGAEGAIFKFKNDEWSNDFLTQGLPPNDINSAWLDREGKQGWAVADLGTILRLEDGKWTEDLEASQLTKVSLNKLWISKHGSLGWAIGNKGTILHFSDGVWSEADSASLLTESNLLDLWLDEQGTFGWATGENGVFLRYNNGSWARDETASSVTNSTLTDIWLSELGSTGWAFGFLQDSITGDFNPEVLHFSGNQWTKYTNSDLSQRISLGNVIFTPDGSEGWSIGNSLFYYDGKRWEQRNEVEYPYQYLQITAGWLNQAETEIWGVGCGGQLLHYSDHKWVADNFMFKNGESDQLTIYNLSSAYYDLCFFDLKMNQSETEGWALGSKGEVLKITSTMVSAPSLRSTSNDEISELSGTFLLEFAHDVIGTPKVEIWDPQVYGQILVQSDSYRSIAPQGTSSRLFELHFKDPSKSLLNPKRKLQLLVTANLVGPMGAVERFKFIKHFTSNPLSEPSLIGQVISFSLYTTITLLALNTVLVFMATRYAWARYIILHKTGAKLVSLFFGKWVIIDPLIHFIPSVRRALLSDYRKNLPQSAALKKWQEKTYITPDILIATGPKKPANEQPCLTCLSLLDYVKTCDRQAIWCVQGVSGLGKTALLENLTLASLEAGYTPFLISLGNSLPPDREICALMNHIGHLPLIITRTEDLEQANDILAQGRFLLLMDGLNEDPTPENTKEFIRRMSSKNKIILTSQTKPKWDDLDIASITLKPFGKEQISQILPTEFIEAVERAKYLADITALPETVQLLARYIKEHQQLPPSSLSIYESLCSTVAKNNLFLNLEHLAWEKFCSNENYFYPSSKIPEDEICLPLVDSGLLTIRYYGNCKAYLFSHEREHRYLVARFLSRKLPNIVFLELHKDIELNFPHSYWADVCEFLGMIIAHEVCTPEVDRRFYTKYLRQVADFSTAIFTKRLFPQYQRYLNTGLLDRDPSFDAWVTKYFAKTVQSLL
ncbi:hypothetical protein [Kordiimonas aestuarii]|uniref:hypothetical protein n=1 Tax=Kordiimonas aestuarii TaxID=1005925 RepID=UPI0021CE17F7|nr:hypothetical protein [Kordiimonas aestuarii]